MENFFELSKTPMMPDLVKILNPYGIDDGGQVFHYGDNFYRGINPARAELVFSYFTSGLISELQNKNLIPHTEIVPHILPPYAFILQHEKIKNVSYAHEWTFTMLKDAALMCVDVMEILFKYGFNSKDAHTGNILFKDNKPVWVDITSFQKAPEYSWSILEFYKQIYQPLEIMSIHPPTARKILKNYIPDWVECFYRNLICKFGVSRGKYFYRAINRYYNIFKRQGNVTNPEDFSRGLQMYRKKIQSLHLNINTQYHNNWLDNNKQIILSDSTKRFLKILNIIKSLPIKSVVEFAANQGMFSAMMATQNNIEKVIATDYDENAADSMYKLLSARKLSDICVKKIFPMRIDFTESPTENLIARIKSDAVAALAMTHHILLSQRMQIENMFERFSRFTNRFIYGKIFSDSVAIAA